MVEVVSVNSVVSETTLLSEVLFTVVAVAEAVVVLAVVVLDAPQPVSRRPAITAVSV